MHFLTCLSTREARFTGSCAAAPERKAAATPTATAGSTLTCSRRWPPPRHRHTFPQAPVRYCANLPNSFAPAATRPQPTRRDRRPATCAVRAPARLAPRLRRAQTPRNPPPSQSPRANPPARGVGAGRGAPFGRRRSSGSAPAASRRAGPGKRPAPPRQRGTTGVFVGRPAPGALAPAPRLFL